MRWKRAVPVLVALALPQLAQAKSYVEDTLSLSSTRATETNPQAGAVTDNLAGSWQTTEDLALGAHLALTHDKDTDSTGAFQNSGGNILLLGLSADWDAGKHVSLGASADVSPRSRQYSDSQLSIDLLGKSIPVDSNLRTDASSYGGTLSFTYDTSDPDADEPSKFDLAVGLNLGATRFSSTQQVVAVAGKQRDLSVSNLRDSYCPKHPKAPLCKVVASLDGQTADVTQFPLEADLTGTIQEDTDVGLAFTWFVYSQDPTEVGFFNIARTGRSASGVAFGSGLPLAPEQWALRPDVDHVFGPVLADLFAEYGQYVDDQGHEASLGFKLKWRVTASWRISLGATFTRETPGAGLTSSVDASSSADAPLTSTLVSGGVRYSF